MIKPAASAFMKDLYDASSKQSAFALMDEYVREYGMELALHNIPFGASYFDFGPRQWLLKRRVKQWVDSVKGG